MSSTSPLTPGRRLSLLLGVPLALLLIAFTALTAVAWVGQGSYSVSQTINSHSSRLRLSVGAGNLRIMPSSDEVTHLDGIVRYSLVRPTVRMLDTAAGVVVETSCPAVPGLCEFDLTLSVPAGVAVDASTSSGNLDATSLGNARLSTDSGDIRVTGLTGTTHLSTSSGSVDARGLTAADVSVSVASGDVSLGFVEAPSSVRVETSSGNITVTVPTGQTYRVNAVTSSGGNTVTVPTDPTSTRTISVSAASGDVQVLARG